jgi:heme oxygenase
MSLKELTKELHAEAENTAFMKAVFAGTLPSKVWTDYTYQKALWYLAIEENAEALGLLKNLQNIKRFKLIMDDYNAMEKPLASYNIYDAYTKEYASYIRALKDPKKVLAHLYVWHVGDMYGGQMIKKAINAPHTHLEFDNLKETLATLREMLDDSMADEANYAFGMAINILRTYDGDLEQSK